VYSDPISPTVGYPNRPPENLLVPSSSSFHPIFFYGLPETRHFRSLMNAARRGLKVGGAARDEVEKIMHGMLRNPAGSWQNLSDLLWILNRLTSCDALTPLATTGLEPLRNKSANDRIQRILDCIHESPGEIPPQGQLSVKFHFSPQAFSRFFRRCMGKTYQEYVAELRVNRTCHALMESDKGIAEIAYEAGFENLSSFNRLFRQIKGMQPRHYRKLTQQT
jgi:AraC-like DNA-binding protein